MNTTSSVVISVQLRNHSDPVEELGWSLAQDVLHITHESVHVSLASSLLDDVLVVVVSQTSRQLLIVHFGLILTEPPSPSNLNETNKSISFTNK